MSSNLFFVNGALNKIQIKIIKYIQIY